MSINQLLFECMNNGVSVILDGENLKVKGHEKTINQFREKLKHHKPEIIRYLQNPKSNYWIVETTDRGTIEVCCSRKMTLDEILEWVPGAISGKPSRCKHEDISEEELEMLANEVIEKAKRYDRCG